MVAIPLPPNSGSVLLVSRLHGFARPGARAVVRPNGNGGCALLPIEYAWRASQPSRTVVHGRESRPGAGARPRRLRRPRSSRRAPASVSSVGDIRSLPAPLTATVDVKLTGTVTFFNSALDQAWIQDATGGVRVDRIGLDPLVHVGDVVELTGRATMGGRRRSSCARRCASSRRARRRRRSGSRRPTSPPAGTNTCSSRPPASSAALDGLARPPGADVRIDGQDLSVGVREVGRADPAQYLDAGVTMQGVLVTNHDAYGRTGRSRLLVSSTREIVDRAARRRPRPTSRCSRCRRW